MLDGDQLQQHIHTLNKGDEASQRQTIHSLKDYGPDEWATVPAKAINQLVAALQHPQAGGTKQTFVRQEILTVLGNIGPRAAPAIPYLIESLNAELPDGIREAAALALGKIGKEAKGAVDALLAMLSDRRPALAVKAMRALGDIGCADQRVRNGLGNLWLASNDSKSTRVQLAIALCKLKIPATGLLGFLTSVLGANQDGAVRKAAAKALAWCSKDEVDVVPALLNAAVGDKDEEVRQIAEASLTHLRLSREKAIQLCRKQLQDSAYAESAMRNSGQLAVPALIDALESHEPAAQEKAARTLGALGDLATQAVPALTAALDDTEVNVRLAAAKSLWLITKNAEPAVSALIELLQENAACACEAGEPRRRFRQTVIEALWRIGPPAQAAIPALTVNARDKNRSIRESAARALLKIAPNIRVPT